jgi:hypothetical protein
VTGYGLYRLKDSTVCGDVGNPVGLPFSNTLMLLIFGAQDSDSLTPCHTFLCAKLSA